MSSSYLSLSQLNKQRRTNPLQIIPRTKLMNLVMNRGKDKKRGEKLEPIKIVFKILTNFARTMKKNGKSSSKKYSILRNWIINLTDREYTTFTHKLMKQKLHEKIISEFNSKSHCSVLQECSTHSRSVCRRSKKMILLSHEADIVFCRWSIDSASHQLFLLVLVAY